MFVEMKNVIFIALAEVSLDGSCEVQIHRISSFKNRQCLEMKRYHLCRVPAFAKIRTLACAYIANAMMMT